MNEPLCVEFRIKLRVRKIDKLIPTIVADENVFRTVPTMNESVIGTTDEKNSKSRKALRELRRRRRSSLTVQYMHPDQMFLQRSEVEVLCHEALRGL